MGVQPKKNTEIEPALACAHCGDACADASIREEEKVFCCAGCRGVYQLLHDNGLENFYRLDERAGRRQDAQAEGEYAWLDIAKLAERFVRYRDAERTHVLLELPTIHCASCIWLLERLPQLLPGVLSCTVDFSRRTATIVFDHRELSLRTLAETLTAIGYPPHTKEQSAAATDAGRNLIFRIGVAGFAFGNIMLLSFPEYLGLGEDAGAGNVGSLIGYLLLVLSVPVLLYSGSVFLSAAWYGLRARRLTIDVPIALGMLALFGRSAYEIFAHTGAGYLDSLAGL
ncbi:MAG: heavy metal translocating P-type ATPase metal-binding domain-containing protein, partial [Bacteroidota bacterium]